MNANVSQNETENLSVVVIDWGFGPGDSDYEHPDNPWFDAEIADHTLKAC